MGPLRNAYLDALGAAVGGTPRTVVARRGDSIAGGIAFLEIGADQGEAIVVLVAARLAGWACRVELDLAGLPRVAVIGRGPG